MGKSKYTEEDFQKAIQLKLEGHLIKDIVELTGIKKPTLDNLFAKRKVWLTPEQHKLNTSRRWEGYEPIVDGKKRCGGKCQQWKLLDDFYPNPSKKTGRHSECISCNREAYLKNNPKEEKDTDSSL